jgi:4-hydroxythreonine-4-phosphate dehydrogenase
MMRGADKPVIAITIGDYNGIGPEVALKSVNHPAVRHSCRPLLVGPVNAFVDWAERLHIRLSDIPILESSSVRRSAISPGKINAQAGRAAASAIEHAAELARAGIVRAIVTAPVSKEAMHRAGIRYPGQTEMLQHLTSSPHVAMMLVSPTMRVGLVTIHVPISQVAKILSRRLLRQQITLFHDALKSDWRIQRPTLAVLGLNPHAGEGGNMGMEDRRIIVPVIRQCRTERMRIEGPFPADSFFGHYQKNTYDAVIAMYHDQGLIPLKMSSAGNAVNVSVGLPIVRTSPDHGTAFNIAGKGIADPRSTIEAIKLAAFIARNRAYRSQRT